MAGRCRSFRSKTAGAPPPPFTLRAVIQFWCFYSARGKLWIPSIYKKKKKGQSQNFLLHIVHAALAYSFPWQVTLKNPTTHSFSCAPLVISEMPYESFAHWPVEVLPLVRPRDQRKAAELQVRGRAATLEAHLLLHSRTCLFSPFLFHSILREKMAQAYDFALDKIGMEIMSYQVHAPQKL